VVWQHIVLFVSALCLWSVRVYVFLLVLWTSSTVLEFLLVNNIDFSEDIVTP